MAIVHEAECDSCKKREPVANTDWHGALAEYPTGWFLLREASNTQGVVHADLVSLCSWPCVEAYAKTMAPQFVGGTVYSVPTTWPVPGAVA